MAATSGSMFWCYECNRQTIPLGGQEVVCTYCDGSFIEEIESGAEAEQGMPLPSLWSRLPSMLGLPFPVFSPVRNRGSGSGNNEINQDQSYRPRLVDGPYLEYQLPVRSDRHHMGDTNLSGSGMTGGRFLIMQGDLPNFVSSLGNAEAFMEQEATVRPQLLPGQLGDFFLGPELDQLIQFLSENDPNRYGPPPASKAAVEAMPTVKITEEHMITECAVCKEDFKLGTDVKRMPCKHMYHEDCIVPWLSQHNTCPVCRFEMPTDQDRSAASQVLQRGSRDASNDGNGARTESAGAETESSQQVDNRQVRISRQSIFLGMPGLQRSSNNVFRTSEEGTGILEDDAGLPLSIPLHIRLISPIAPSVEINSVNAAERTDNLSGITAGSANQHHQDLNSNLTGIKQEELD